MKRYLLIPALLFSSTLLADQTGPEWNYFEAGFTESEFGDLEPNGAFGNLSVLFDNNIFITAGHSALRQDVTLGNDVRGELKLYESTVGLGYRYGLNSTTDLSAGFGFVNLETCTVLGRCDDDDGMSIDVSLRSMVTNQIELFAGVQYVDVADNDTAGIVGVAYNFTEDFAIKLSYKDSDDLQATSLSARFEF